MDDKSERFLKEAEDNLATIWYTIPSQKQEYELCGRYICFTPDAIEGQYLVMVVPTHDGRLETRCVPTEWVTRMSVTDHGEIVFFKARERNIGWMN